MKLSTTFDLAQFVYSDTAKRKGIDNTPTSPEIVSNLHKLYTVILEPMRKALGRDIYITSGYRCEALNRAIGGSKTSQHMKGQAADLHVEGMTAEELFNFLRSSDIIADQVIQEFGSWVHISYAPTPRRQFLRAVKHGTKTVYLPELPA